jgi:hypothetical protein
MCEAGIAIACDHGHAACTAREESAGSTSAVWTGYNGWPTGPALVQITMPPTESRTTGCSASLWMTADNRLSLQQPGGRIADK